MRVLLEVFGLVTPSPGRREPGALPAWTRWAVPVAVTAFGVHSVVVAALVRLAVA